MIDQKDDPFHALEPDAALARLEADAEGLSGAEAEKRLQDYGPNRLPEARAAARSCASSRSSTTSSSTCCWSPPW
jgi:hypothetical protein